VEALKEGLEKVERHRKVHQNTSMPSSFSQILPSGKDLYVAANMSEIAALSGMPEEHQRRTVVIAPRMLKTMQSGMYPLLGRAHTQTQNFAHIRSDYAGFCSPIQRFFPLLPIPFFPSHAHAIYSLTNDT